MQCLDSHFVEINSVEKEGDIMVFNTKESPLFHLGIFTHNKKLLHQPNNQLSQEVYLTPDILKKVYKIYRYKDL